MEDRAEHKYKDFDKFELERLVASAQDYFISNGMIRVELCPEEFRKYNENSEYILFGFNVCLYPYKIKEEHFNKANKLANQIATLYHKISLDSNFIEEALGRTIVADDFVKRLFEIYKRSLTEPAAPQQLYFSIQRADYMLHHEENNGEVKETLQQVEVNTISCSFVNLTAKIPKYYRYIMRAFPHIYKDYDYNKVRLTGSNRKGCEALVRAHNAFIKLRKEKNLYRDDEKIIVVMVTQVMERNSIDLRGMEQMMLEKYDVTMRGYNFQQLDKLSHLNESFDLVIDDYGERVIASVIYFRSSYTPDDFKSDNDWEVRLMLEKSSAAKCPNLPTQLVGAKKVQQYLCEDGVLERFFPNEKEFLESIRSCFTGIYEVHRNGKYKEYYEDAIRHPHRYLLKPQREGGGHMIYGEQLKEYLLEMSDEQLDAFVLMKKIIPKPVDNIQIKHKVPSLTRIVTEFGIFQEYLAVNGEVEANRNLGYLVRSKDFGIDDGGVMAGNASMDTFYVY